MKIPSIIKRFCKSCITHTKMSVNKPKKGSMSNLLWINRQKKRATKGSGNKGKFSKPPKTVYKVNKRPLFTLVCQICSSKKIFSRKSRAKRAQIVKVKL